MSFVTLYLQTLGVIMVMMTLLWLASIRLRNVSIVDPFWGAGFVLVTLYGYFKMAHGDARSILVLVLVLVWGLRLSLYLAWRNTGKGEDFRYRAFRERYGKGYWWISFFQTFLLQGVLMWLISAPLTLVQHRGGSLGVLDVLALLIWVIGFVFEAGGDWQLARFRSDPANRGKLLQTGLWKYTRHPNYFGDAAVWWGYGLFAIAAGAYLPFLGTLLMTALIIKVSGVALLEKTLVGTKPGYDAYLRRTSAFLPWFPSKAKTS
jgi:steroid 5-alpha reductase family enzyme